MFKTRCPCCSEKISFKHYLNALSSFTILYEGYSCSSCKKNLLDKKFGWLSTSIFYLIFPMITFIIDEFFPNMSLINTVYLLFIISGYMFVIGFFLWQSMLLSCNR